MRAIFPVCRCPLFLCITMLISPLMTAAARGQATSNSVGIDYTGSLMGYYRMEYGETPQNAVLPPVQSFLSVRQKDSSRLLLGMGDNFGPEFGASLQLEGAKGSPCHDDPKPTPSGEGRPESLYKDDDRAPKEAQCDNVMNFLMQAGFRAVVPGSQDFMYTARWLRVAAVEVWQVSHTDLNAANADPAAVAQRKMIDNDEHRLYMLGANLRISMKHKGGEGDAAGGSHEGGGTCPLLFSQDPLDEEVFRCVGDGTEPEPFDWLNRLDRLSRDPGNNPTVTALQDLAAESAVQANARQVELDQLIRDEISILQSAWSSRFNDVPTLPRHGEAQNAKAGSHAEGSAAGSQPEGKPKNQQADNQPLTEGDVKAFLDRLNAMAECHAETQTADAKDMCTYANRLSEILDTYTLILEARVKNPAGATGSQPAGGSKVNGAKLILTPDDRQPAIRGLLRTIAHEESDVGYTMADAGNGNKVLVVGVVGQDTMKAVSETNLHMCRGKKGDPITDFDSCGDRRKPGKDDNNGAEVLVTDPVEAAQAIVRGAALLCAEDSKCQHFQRVVVMAQMPHTEAEILSQRIWAQLKLAKETTQVDVLLSEAESGYGTPNLSVAYHDSAKNSTQPAYPAAVVTPATTYSSQTGSYPGAVSLLTLNTQPDNSFSLANQRDDSFEIPKVTGSDTTISLLYKLVEQLRAGPKNQPTASSTVNTANSAASSPTVVGEDQESRQKAEFALMRDLQKASPPRADVVLLQSRDVELDAIGQGYTGYEMCAGETPDEKYQLCELRTALDRIFWKGDYLEYVAITGKDLKQMLNLSQQTMAQQAQLADTGPTGQWLISYGIVQSGLTNLTQISQNNEPLWIPVDPRCKGDSGKQSTYCIDGTPITDDAYYWLLTTDQLAQDKAIYGTLQALPSDTHKVTEKFVSAPLSHFLQNNLNNSADPSLALNLFTGTAETKKPVETLITADNERFQQRELFQVDFAKVIASFISREAVGGNQFVQNYFQAVSDARATAPDQQSLDLEMGSRVLYNVAGSEAPSGWLPPFSIGEQSAFSYTRAVIGNLTGKPINATYPLNNLTEGAFLQVRLGGSKDSVRSVQTLPRSLLVFTPHQYQLEIDTPYLFLPFSTGQVPSGELTVQLPRIQSWTDRVGFREEFGQSHSKFSGRYLPTTGSYVETGMEFSIQNGNLSSLTLQTGSKQKTCPVLANVTFQTCFGSASYGTPGAVLTINDTTTIVGRPFVQTLHTPGYYWDLHFQNHIYGKQGTKQISLVTDSQGDYYFGRPPAAELPTQTEYAIPLNLSLVLPSLGNLSFAPTYSAFFFKPQLSSQSLLVNTFSISARWYFARDARVPVPKQAPLPGPQSANQTVTGKSH
jgi:hypothetical protein